MKIEVETNPYDLADAMAAAFKHDEYELCQFLKVTFENLGYQQDVGQILSKALETYISANFDDV